MISIWILPVFAYCVWLGRRFTKRCAGHWLSFFFLPALFFTTALCSLLFLHNITCLLYYLLNLWIGCLIGLLITNRTPIKIDIILQSIAAPGSSLLFICLMTLCISKCIFDVLNVSLPHQIFQLKIISFAIKGLVTGLLCGQALSFWYRFSVANKYSTTELVKGRFAFFSGLGLNIDFATC